MHMKIHEIEKDIPLPYGRFVNKGTQQEAIEKQLTKLKKGDSFKFEGNMKSLCAIASKFKKKHPRKNFTARSLDSKTSRIWRIK